MKQAKQEKFEQQVKSVLDQSVEDINADTRYQLQMARAKVLQSNEGASLWYQKKPMWASVASFASVSVLVTVLMFSSSEYKQEALDVVTNQDSILFESDTGIDMYEQYDFYVWLSTQEVKT